MLKKASIITLSIALAAIFYLVIKDPTTANFIALGTLILGIVTALLEYKRNAETQKKLEEFQEFWEYNPIVVAQPDNSPTNEKWDIKNIGKTAAINLRIGIVPHEQYRQELILNEGPIFTMPSELIKLNSIDSEQRIPIDWENSISIIYLLYQNKRGEEFISIMTDHSVAHSKVDGNLLLNFYNGTLSFGNDSYIRLNAINAHKSISAVRADLSTGYDPIYRANTEGF